MGLLGGKKDAPLHDAELQKIKEKVINAKNEKNDKEPPPKLIKTDFVGNSQNPSDVGSFARVLDRLLSAPAAGSGLAKSGVFARSAPSIRPGVARTPSARMTAAGHVAYSRETTSD